MQQVVSVTAKRAADRRDARVVPVLCVALEDRDPRVRRAAAEALAEVGDMRAFFPLQDATMDQDEKVRSRAYQALQKVKARCEDGPRSSRLLGPTLLGAAVAAPSKADRVAQLAGAWG